MSLRYPSIETVALRIAVMLKRSDKRRARLSEKSFRILSERVTLRDAFVVSVRDYLDEIGVVLIRLDRGGFALINSSALEGAPPILVKSLIPKFKNISDDELWTELGFSESQDLE